MGQPDDSAPPRPAVVAVHGAGGGGWEWSIWARVFGARGFEFAAPDLQPAAAGLEATRLSDYRDQVVEWCSGTAGPVVLVGASLGGLLAMMAAEAAGAQAIVLVNPLPPSGLPGAQGRRPPRIAWAGAGPLARTRRAMGDADDAAVLYAHRRWRDESGAVVDEACAGVAVPAPRVPALVLAAACDEDVPPAASRALAFSVGADFVLLAGATHVGPLLGRGAADVAGQAAGWIETATRGRAV